MIVVVRNFDILINCTAGQQTTLIEALSVALPGQVDAFGDTAKEEFFRYVTYDWMSVPAGLLYYVHEIATNWGWNPQYTDMRTQPVWTTEYPTAHMTFEPYEDQAKAAEIMLERSRGVLDLATNFGKTYLIAAFWNKIVYSNMLVVVPTQALLIQTREDLAKLSGLDVSEIGVVGDGSANWRGCTVAVANSVDNWIKQYGSLPIQFNALIVDEGHYQKSNRAYTIASACDAYYRFWLSGTAYKDNEPEHVMAMTGIAGPLLASVSNKYLVATGRSAFPHINFIDIKAKKFDPTKDHASQYKMLKEWDHRNEVIRCVCEYARYNDLVSVVFVEHKGHLRRLADMMPYADVVYGANAAANERIRQKLKNRETSTVISTPAWRLGVSTDGIDHLLHAGGLKARANILQELGRGLRRKPADRANRCFYTDFIDSWAYVPRKHSKTRWATLAKEGFPMNVKELSDIPTMFRV